jgi:enterochelin esterase-like enzyme
MIQLSAISLSIIEGFSSKVKITKIIIQVYGYQLLVKAKQNATVNIYSKGKSVRKIFWILIVSLLLFPLIVHAQSESEPFTSIEEFQIALEGALIDVGEFEALWTRLLENQQIPLTIGETAIFLYRGEAETVEWYGDFNSWGYTANALGERQGDTDLWMLTQEFPSDARLDYKIVLDGNNWILDPNNPLQQMNAFGPNSEVRMPDYVPSPYVIYRDDIEHGTLTDDQLIDSTNMGYSINYRVYQPVNYSELDDLPVIYVTDGQYYANDEIGSMVIVLDNIIAEGLIKPVMAVFIDPRDPNDSTINRREHEFIVNPLYGDFLATELVPPIDELYDTNPTPEARVILGTSYGGLNAAYVGLRYSDVFGMLAINSPAFWAGPIVYTQFQENERLSLNIFMTTGCPWDICADAQQMRAILEEREYPLRYIEVHEGHSWGNWRALLDDMLIYFFGVE